MQTLMGLETEYGIAMLDRKGKRLDPEHEANLLMSLALKRFPTLQSLDGQGCFTSNGAKFYIDVGSHPEYATPECGSPKELVRYIIAGHKMMAELQTEIERKRSLSTLVFAGNTGYGDEPQSWACHESYLCRHEPRRYTEQIVPFLVSRLIYTGSGGFDPYCHGIRFSISPRSHFLRTVANDETMRSRPIVNLRDQAHASGNYHRLHLIVSDAIGSQTAMWLRAGTTALTVAMIDAGVRPVGDLTLADPLAAMHAFALDPSLTAKAAVNTVEPLTALEIQHLYLAAAKGVLASAGGADRLPTWAPAVVSGWETMLQMLEENEEALELTLDWKIKLAIFEAHCEDRGVKWSSLPHWTEVLNRLHKARNSDESSSQTSLESLLQVPGPVKNAVRKMARHLEEHALDLGQLPRIEALRAELFELETRFLQLGGLFDQLTAQGVLKHGMLDEEEIARAVGTPPSNGRAALRGNFVQQHAHKSQYRAGWTSLVDAENEKQASLADPFTDSLVWCDFEPEPVRSISSFSIREAALIAFRTGEYEDALGLLLQLHESGFEQHSTLCHLVRVCLVTDALESATGYANMVWERRGNAPVQILPRIIWIRIALNMLAHGTDREIGELLGAMKRAIREAGAYSWTIEPVLVCLQGKIPQRHHLLLTQLVRAISETGETGDLEAFPIWREANEVNATEIQ